MLSNTSKYAIRALIYLELYSNPENKVGIKEISKQLDMPSPFLGKILQVLVKQNFLNSTKGPNGGFYLKRAAIDIALMEVIEVIDGKESFETCVIRTSACDHDNPCSMHDKMAPLWNELRRVFATETIADLVSEFRENRERIRI
jgi:Rrf2 family iron-sulfur cluster assembly transcriptional regulator